MEKLKYKNVLFFGIGFYDYDKSIIEELKKRNCSITYIKTVPDGSFPRLLNRMGFKKLASSIVSNDINRGIVNAPNGIDCIFIIIGDNLNEDHFSIMSKKYPSVPIILYLWDDIERISNYNILKKHCDRILTFDSADAEKYNLILRPLFFRIMSGNNKSDCLIKYAISFVGWHHSLRYPIISKLREELDKNGLEYKFVLLGRRWYYYIERYFLRTIKKKDQDLFIFKSLNYDDYIKITKCSRVILDIPHPSQKGLTIRTVESLALGKKIYTTNTDIEKYGFNINNYRVFNIDNISIDYEFLREDVVIPEIMDKYSISQFVEDIFAYEK